MAGRGPAPQSQHQRPRDTARRQAGGDTVKVDRRTRGPKLPDGHLPETVEWYEALRKSPHAQTWLDVDWQHLQMIAHLVDRWAANGHKALDWQEIRLNLANYGLSPADRARLKLRVERPEDAPEKDQPAGVTSISAARDAVAARLGRSS